MAQTWRWNDSYTDLLRKICNNTAEISSGGGGGGWPPSDTTKYQKGTVAITPGNQGPYVVAFAPAMASVPTVDLQVYMPNNSDDLMFADPVSTTVTAAGFQFWLSAAPVSAGSVKWVAQI